MNGYGREYGVSYRTLQRIFETLEMKRAKAEAAASRIEKVNLAAVTTKRQISRFSLRKNDLFPLF